MTRFDYLLNAVEAASHHDDPSSQNYAAKRSALITHVRQLEADAALLKVAQRCFVAADFAYPQMEGEVCLVLRLPSSVRVSADLREALRQVPV